MKSLDLISFCNIHEKAGNCITLKGSSKHLRFIYKLQTDTDVPFASQTGMAVREGFAMLISCNEGEFWLPFDQLINRSPIKEIDINLDNYVSDWERGYYLLIYLPIFSQLSNFTIEYEEETALELIDFFQREGVGYIGEDNTKGIGVSTSSMNFFNILSRWSGREARNLSFRYESLESQLMNIDGLLDCSSVVVEINSELSVEIIEHIWDTWLTKLNSFSGTIVFWTSASSPRLIDGVKGLLEKDSRGISVAFIDIIGEEKFEECVFNKLGLLNDYGNYVLAKKIMNITQVV